MALRVYAARKAISSRFLHPPRRPPVLAATGGESDSCAAKLSGIPKADRRHVVYETSRESRYPCAEANTRKSIKHRAPQLFGTLSKPVRGTNRVPTLG